MLVLWLSASSGRTPLANVWDRNFASFCFQTWQNRDAVLGAHLTQMLRTYLKAEEQAWIVRGAIYECLNVHDHPRYRGIVNARFDPWHPNSLS